MYGYGAQEQQLGTQLASPSPTSWEGLARETSWHYMYDVEQKQACETSTSNEPAGSIYGVPRCCLIRLQQNYALI